MMSLNVNDLDDCEHVSHTKKNNNKKPRFISMVNQFLLKFVAKPLIQRNNKVELSLIKDWKGRPLISFLDTCTSKMERNV